MNRQKPKIADHMGSYRKNKIRRKADLVYLVAGEIFIKYADEFFPFLFGREGSFDQKGAYLSMV